MNKTNIDINNGLSKEEFLKKLGFEKDSKQFQKASNIFDAFDLDKNSFIDSNEQIELTNTLNELDKNNDKKISRREHRKNNNTIFNDIPRDFSQEVFDTFNSMLESQENRIKNISDNNNTTPKETETKKEDLYIDNNKIIQYLMNGDKINSIDLSKEITILEDKKHIKFNDKIFSIIQNQDSYIFVNESIENNKKIYTTLKEEIKNTQSNDIENHFHNRGDKINLLAKYNQNGEIQSSNNDGVRQEQTIGAAILNSNNETTLKLGVQKQLDGTSYITDGESFLEFLGKDKLSKQDLIDFLIAVEKNSKQATETPVRKYAKDVDIDVKDLININAIFTKYSQDGFLNKDGITMLINDLQKSNIATIVDKIIEIDNKSELENLYKYFNNLDTKTNTENTENTETENNNQTKDKNNKEIVEIFNNSINDKITFPDNNDKPKVFINVNPEDFTNFQKRLNNLSKQNQKPNELLIMKTTENYNGEKVTQINDFITVYQTNDSFKVITNTNQGKNINQTRKFNNGYFYVSDTNIQQKRINGKRQYTKTTNEKYYTNTGQEISDIEFFNTVYNYNPNYKNENSQIRYNKDGITYIGDNYSSSQDNSNIIKVKNITKNETSEIDLDYLLRDIQNQKYKSMIMSAIQQLPGEALFDLAKEVQNIVLFAPSRGSYDVAGRFLNDFIQLNQTELDTMSIEDLKSTITHELGHAVDGNLVNKYDFNNEVTPIFDNETEKINEIVGDTYDNLGDYYETILKKKRPEIKSGYAATNLDENFAERYSNMMNVNNKANNILEFYPETSKKQMEHLLEIKSLPSNKRNMLDGAFRIDNILSPYFIKPNYPVENKIGLAYPIELVKNNDNPDQYKLYMYKDDKNKIPIKIINFNSATNLDTKADFNTMLFNISDIIPTSIIEYPLNNENIAYITTIDIKNNTKNTEKIIKPE